MRRALATTMVVALFGGISATAASAAADSAPSLRAQIDVVGGRYFAAKEAARVLDLKSRALDRELAVTRKHVAALRPMAKATAVQIYQSAAQGFTALFDVDNAMESARHAELIARAGERTQALLDKYVTAADRLGRQQTMLRQARAKQAGVVADLARQSAALDRLLATSQQAYRARLAAQARTAAAAEQSPPSTQAAAPTTNPPAPPAPVPVDPPAPPDGGVNPHHNDPFLVCTRTRESGGNYAAVNGAGYYGAYQFSQPTWDLTASHAGLPELIGVRPDAASPWYQDQLAWVLYQWQGNGPWLGLC